MKAGAARHRLILGIGFSLLVSVMLLRLVDPEAVEGLRFEVFDLYQRLHPRPYVPGLPVRILDRSMRRRTKCPLPKASFRVRLS